MLNESPSEQAPLAAIEITTVGNTSASPSAAQVPALTSANAEVLEGNVKKFLNAVHDQVLASRLLVKFWHAQSCRRVVAYAILQRMLRQQWLRWGNDLTMQLEHAEKQLHGQVYKFRQAFNPPVLSEPMDVEYSTNSNESTASEGLPKLKTTAEMAAEASATLIMQERALRAHWQHLLATSQDKALLKRVRQSKRLLQDARDRYETFVVLRKWRILYANEQAVLANITHTWGEQALPAGVVFHRLWQQASPPFINTLVLQEAQEQEQKYRHYDHYQSAHRLRVQAEMQLAMLCRADAHYQDFCQHVIAQCGVSLGADEGDYGCLNALAEACGVAVAVWDTTLTRLLHCYQPQTGAKQTVALRYDAEQQCYRYLRLAPMLDPKDARTSASHSVAEIEAKMWVDYFYAEAADALLRMAYSQTEVEAHVELNWVKALLGEGAYAEQQALKTDNRQLLLEELRYRTQLEVVLVLVRDLKMRVVWEHSQRVAQAMRKHIDGYAVRYQQLKRRYDKLNARIAAVENKFGLSPAGRHLNTQVENGTQAAQQERLELQEMFSETEITAIEQQYDEKQEAETTSGWESEPVESDDATAVRKFYRGRSYSKTCESLKQLHEQRQLSVAQFAEMQGTKDYGAMQQELSQLREQMILVDANQANRLRQEVDAMMAAYEKTFMRQTPEARAFQYRLMRQAQVTYAMTLRGQHYELNDFAWNTAYDSVELALSAIAQRQLQQFAETVGLSHMETLKISTGVYRQVVASIRFLRQQVLPGLVEYYRRELEGYLNHYQHPWWQSHPSERRNYIEGQVQQFEEAVKHNVDEMLREGLKQFKQSKNILGLLQAWEALGLKLQRFAEVRNAHRVHQLTLSAEEQQQRMRKRRQFIAAILTQHPERFAALASSASTWKSLDGWPTVLTKLGMEDLPLCRLVELDTGNTLLHVWGMAYQRARRHGAPEAILSVMEQAYQLLLKQGGDWRDKNRRGHTPMNYARVENMEKALLQPSFLKQAAQNVLALTPMAQKVYESLCHEVWPQLLKQERALPRWQRSRFSRFWYRGEIELYQWELQCLARLIAALWDVDKRIDDRPLQRALGRLQELPPKSCLWQLADGIFDLVQRHRLIPVLPSLALVTQLERQLQQQERENKLLRAELEEARQAETKAGEELQLSREENRQLTIVAQDANEKTRQSDEHAQRAEETTQQAKEEVRQAKEEARQAEAQAQQSQLEHDNQIRSLQAQLAQSQRQHKVIQLQLEQSQSAVQSLQAELRTAEASHLARPSSASPSSQKSAPAALSLGKQRHSMVANLGSSGNHDKMTDLMPVALTGERHDSQGQKFTQ